MTEWCCARLGRELMKDEAMDFEVIKRSINRHMDMPLLPYTAEMYYAICDLDINRLNAEIVRVHNAVTAGRGLAPSQTPKPPVFVIPESWGVDADQIWNRYQAHKERAAHAGGPFPIDDGEEVHTF